MSLQPGAVIEDRHGTWRVVGQIVADRRSGEHDLVRGDHELVVCEDIEDPNRKGFMKIHEQEGEE